MKTFPMFLCVANRSIVIIGGDEQAAQKCRLVLKTDADIVVAWHELSPELAELEKQGRISWHREAVNASTFENAALVFIAICLIAPRLIMRVGHIQSILEKKLSGILCATK
ncbi:MAG: NAD(P)-dependent oxidoreductase [Rhizobiaceae bacterium]